MARALGVVLVLATCVAGAASVDNDRIVMEVGVTGAAVQQLERNSMVRTERKSDVFEHRDQQEPLPEGVTVVTDDPVGGNAAAGSGAAAAGGGAANGGGAVGGGAAGGSNDQEQVEEQDPADSDDTTVDDAAAKEKEVPLVKPSVTYEKAVMDSEPVGYWSMSDLATRSVEGPAEGETKEIKRTSAQGRACGKDWSISSGDPCFVEGEVSGVPEIRSGLLPSNQNNNNSAFSFSGADNEEVVIPDSNFINTDKHGYRERTVELWFKSNSAGGEDSDAQAIYCEGNKHHSGLSMYVQDDQAGKVWLNMFAWDRGNSDNEFGTQLITPEPIRCEIAKDTVYYTVMVFDGTQSQHGKQNSFTSWIGSPSGLKLCGQTNIRNDAKIGHHGHDGGNAVIGGIHTSSRASGKVELVAGSHNFKGSVDEVAIYNKALSNSTIKTHWEAGMATR